MNTEVELSGRALDEAIATAIGWTKVIRHPLHKNYDHEFWHVPEERIDRPSLPAYSSSVDALREPEARLREAGLTQSVETDGVRWLAHWRRPEVKDAPAWYGVWAGSTARAGTEAEARAQACLLALTAIAAIEEAQHGT